jgi:hypothetical protein
VLGAIATEVESGVSGLPHPASGIEEALNAWRGTTHPEGPRNVRGYEDALRQARVQRPARLEWDTDLGSLQAEFAAGRFISVYLDAKRHLAPKAVSGPLKLEWTPPALSPMGLKVADQFLQFLVNKKTEQAFAATDGDHATADGIEAWFQGLWKQIGRLMEDDRLKVTFDRQAYNFLFTRGDGYAFDLRTLADGHAAVLSILAELLLRIDVAERVRGDRSAPTNGVVIVDEIETHLHLKLQEDVLPFLSATFPGLQFVLATHSPAVIASIPGALVYDLAKGTASPSESFQGIRYGALMTGHFGIPDDIDLDTLDKLRAMRALADRPRNEDEERRFEELTAELSKRSPSMALEVWIAKAEKSAAE